MFLLRFTFVGIYGFLSSGRRRALTLLKKQKPMASEHLPAWFRPADREQGGPQSGSRAALRSGAGRPSEREQGGPQSGSRAARRSGAGRPADREQGGPQSRSRAARPQPSEPGPPAALRARPAGASPGRRGRFDGRKACASPLNGRPARV